MSSLAARTLVLLAASIVLEIIAQAVTGLSPIRDSESMLALGPYGAIEKVSLCLRGGLVFLLLEALRLTIPLGARSPWGGVLLGYAAAAKFVIAFAVTDPTSRPVTVHGTVHAAFAFTSFFAAAVGAILIARKLPHDGTVPRQLLLRLAWWMLACAVLITVTVALQLGFWGLLERIDTAISLGWIAIAALALQQRRQQAPLGSLS